MPVLALHPPFDTVLGMVLDILHAPYIGVVKALLSLWTLQVKVMRNIVFM